MSIQYLLLTVPSKTSLTSVKSVGPVTFPVLLIDLVLHEPIIEKRTLHDENSNISVQEEFTVTNVRVLGGVVRTVYKALERRP